MSKIVRYIPLVVVLFTGIILQAGFIAVDKQDSPNKAAVEFSKAYFLLDDCTMAKYVCKSLISSNAIGDYMDQTARQASNRGFDTSYLKSRISHIQTQVKKIDDTHVTVTVTATKRKSINPLFELVGTIFSLGKTTPVEQDIDLVKEDDEWKVCGEPLHLS